MNSLYRFQLWVTSAVELGGSVVARPTRLLMSFGADQTRAVHGIVAQCQATGRDERGRAMYVLGIVPSLFVLTKRRASRIFQDQTTLEIVSEILGMSRVAFRWSLQRRLEKRAYCVQYDETDFAFVSRLCAADGIFFYFQHPLPSSDDAPVEGSTSGEVVVFIDSADSYPSLSGGPELRWVPTPSFDNAMTHPEPSVWSFHVAHSLATERVLMRSFDFAHPTLSVRDAHTHGGPSALHAREERDRAGMLPFVDEGLTVYEHENVREEGLVQSVPARLALEAETADAAVASGETASRRLLPGYRFSLAEHSLGDLDGEYAIVSVTHEGRDPAAAASGEPVYSNRFQAVPASRPFRAARAKAVRRQTIETATVVGPTSDELYTDEYGRVKVRFHWDLSAEKDGQSSAWLRVAQPWAGAGYGAQFLPRVGNEVLVGYIDGDTDRPIVLASLHNAANPPPLSLPRNKAQTGIMTWATPHGSGGNALLFDDTVGSELAALRSSRTLDLAAAEDGALTAQRTLNLSAGQDLLNEAIGSRTLTVGSDDERKLGRDRTTTIARNEVVRVGGVRDTEIAGTDLLRVDGIARQVFKRSRITVVGADPTSRGDERVSASGEYRVGSAREMRLSSDEAIVLECGQSRLTITKGSILLDAPTIQLQATDRISLVQGAGGGSSLTLDGSAHLGGATVAAVAGGKNGELARLFLDTKAHLDGVEVLLNCGPLGAAGGAREGSPDATGVVRFTVARAGLPAEITSVTLRIATPTGEIVERECTVGGSVEMVGNMGDVFTIVETLVAGRPISITTKSSTGDREG